MKTLKDRAEELLKRYADLDGMEDIDETEFLLEEAMNIISEIKVWE